MKSENYYDVKVMPHLNGVGATLVALQIGRLKPPLPIPPCFSEGLHVKRLASKMLFNKSRLASQWRDG